jgi:ketosteroid isomerase-like protein
MDESQRTRIRQVVERRMQSFEAAERALDAERLIEHFANEPDFYIHNDGHRLTYAGMTTAVRAAFPTLRSIEGGFSGVDIVVLAPDAALATATFQEAVTARSDAVVRQRGAATWLWRFRDGEWRIIYGHVDHYADTSTT